MHDSRIHDPTFTGEQYEGYMKVDGIWRPINTEPDIVKSNTINRVTSDELSSDADTELYVSDSNLSNNDEGYVESESESESENEGVRLTPLLEEKLEEYDQSNPIPHTTLHMEIITDNVAYIDDDDDDVKDELDIMLKSLNNN